ncbi:MULTISPECIES: glutamate 5-kinase [unclassified Lactococcus]|uniref:glutamate 5-kinase n=1 Tax=unclassified Lactococcus TaxID=2643510 RepID=UPI0011C9D2BE|nr:MULTISPECIES: glutamate 5-kinase [unclassified Lactococcus]MQW23694.1 glutamate 5-kinase [Lactococcus sp. dk101]TXK37526.1 glutamate 5-kinase [Lactococcus sp. dk310]TXK48956.1 glutamate 5-kinase [Lactococcus sp. dk322]
MRNLENINRMVIKVGTSTLTYENGSLNLRRIEQLARLISDLQNSGKHIVLVSSGAIGVGAQKLGMDHRPTTVKEKQAAAAIGQAQLMEIYDEFFRQYNQLIGQVLLTHLVLTDKKMHDNAVNTFQTLLEFNVIPIVNENDTVVTDEILFGDNDTLSAHIANMVKADMLVMLTDIDGLYDMNPNENPDARLIREIPVITDQVREMAGGVSSNRGTGGMATKLLAAQIAQQSKTRTVIMNGADPSKIYNLLEGEEIGTYFDC